MTVAYHLQIGWKTSWICKYLHLCRCIVKERNELQLTSIRQSKQIFCLILTSAANKSACDDQFGLSASNLSKSPLLNAYNRSTSHWLGVPFREVKTGCWSYQIKRNHFYLDRTWTVYMRNNLFIPIHQSYRCHHLK